MGYQRQTFVLGDTGTQVDTGIPFSGTLEQVRWLNTSGDTGGTLELVLMQRSGDTGDGFLFANHGLTPQFTKSYVIPTHHSDGLDTGAAQETKVTAAGDRLRVKKTGATGAGRLYVWSKD